MLPQKVRHATPGSGGGASRDKPHGETFAIEIEKNQGEIPSPPRRGYSTSITLSRMAGLMGHICKKTRLEVLSRFMRKVVILHYCFFFCLIASQPVLRRRNFYDEVVELLGIIYLICFLFGAFLEAQHLAIPGTVRPTSHSPHAC